MNFFVLFNLFPPTPSRIGVHASAQSAGKSLTDIFIHNKGAFVGGVHVNKEKVKSIRIFSSGKSISELNAELRDYNKDLSFMEQELIDTFIENTCTEITDRFLEEHVTDKLASPNTSGADPVSSAESPEPSAQIFVFISYAHEDSSVAKSIANILTEKGIKHFLDKKEIVWGNKITAKVRKALHECSHQIIIFSPASSDSGWVHYECGSADGQNKIVLPYRTHRSQRIPDYLADTVAVHSLKAVRAFFPTIVDPQKPLAHVKVRRSKKSVR